jgi:beta-mannanase
MKNELIVLFCCAAGLQSFTPKASAQPAVYSGAFTFSSGDLNTLAKQQTITNFANDAQKDVAIINMFESWTSGSSTNGTISFPTTGVNYIRGHGSIPLLTWQPQNGNLGTNQSFTLAHIINGAYDPYITNWATAAKNWGHPFFLRLAHEMNGNWYPWGAGVNGNTTGQYVQMWRHVHDIFTGVGATNVTWVWCVNFVSPSFAPIDQLYPGDNYVDWISVDGYNRLANAWQDYSVLAAPTVAQLTNLVPGKPIMVAETGCNQNTNHDKGQWFLNALTNYLPAAQPRIKAWVYFNSTNTSDGNEWRITVPTNAVGGYQKGIALPYYAANQYGAISSSPIQPLLNDATMTDRMAPFISIVSPATDVVTNGALVKFLAVASDKSGISRVVFSVNGVAQQTNNSPPYQFSWTVPVAGGVTYNVAATAYDNAGNSAVSTIQGISPVALKTAAAPKILAPTWNETNLTLQTSSQAGFNYVLQATPQLAPANWTATQTNPGGGLVTFTIPITSTQQFFRICVQ